MLDLVDGLSNDALEMDDGVFSHVVDQERAFVIEACRDPRYCVVSAR
jgi:hypothetical protein